MSIFAKKPEWEQKVMADVGSTPQPKPSGAKPGAYGIAEAIQLLRSLPTDQGAVVVRVVRATLASLDVHLADIIEDASRKQKHLADRMAAEHAQVADLERQLEARRREIAAIEADLKETSSVKDRLLQAEKTAGLPGGTAPRATSTTPRPSTGQTPAPGFLSRAPREEPTVRPKD